MPTKLKLKNRIDVPLQATDTTVDTINHTALVTSSSTDLKPIFQNHLLVPRHQKAQYAAPFTPDWLTISLIGILLLFTWYKIFYYRMFQQLTKAFFSMATTNQVVRDESILLQRASLNSSAIAYLIGGLFIYQISIAGNWQHPFLLGGFIRFLYFAMAIALLFSCKMIAIRFLSNVFNVEKPASTYIFTVFLFNMMAGLALLPFVILIAYSPMEYRHSLINIGLIVLSFFLIYRLVRVFIIWNSQLRAPLFYLFLYLCAFEIAPLLLIGKFASIQ